MFSTINKKTKRTAFIILMALSFSLINTGCSNKAEEDAAAIRAMMEKKVAEEDAQKAKQAAHSAARQKGADAPVIQYKY